MNKDLKRLIANILKERRNHNPIPLRVSNTIHLLIEEKTISDIIDLRDLIEYDHMYFKRMPGVNQKSLQYLKDKLYSMFTFKTIVESKEVA